MNAAAMEEDLSMLRRMCGSVNGHKKYYLILKVRLYRGGIADQASDAGGVESAGARTDVIRYVGGPWIDPRPRDGCGLT